MGIHRRRGYGSARYVAAVSAFAFAVFGVGAAFAANAPAMIVPGQFNVGATGAFSYTIPIAVPPGTAGMVPALSLDYSSQGGDGLEGLGWSLSGLPSISRCPRTMAQDRDALNHPVHGGVNFDSNDRFCLEGQRLIPIVGANGANGTEYRTEINGFSRIVSYGTAGNGPAWFKVWTKSGQVMEFGNTTDSQAPVLIPPVQSDDGGNGTGGGGNNSGGGNTLGANPPPPAGATLMPTVRAWAVNKISDTTGNYLIVKYDGGSQDLATAQVYPTEIDYTANGSHQAYNSVKFTYMTRVGSVPVYQAGAFMQNTQLLTAVITYAGTAVVSDYRLTYDFASFGDEHDELKLVTLCDGVAVGANCLAPTSFTWQGSRDALTYTSQTNALLADPTDTAHANTLTGSRTEFRTRKFIADLNGDGLTDAVALMNQNELCPASAGSVFFGNQDGVTFSTTTADVAQQVTATFNPAYAQNNPDDCSGTATFYSGLTQLFDYDGDGIPDVLVEDHDHNSENQYYILHKDTPSHFATMNPDNLLLANTAGGQAVTGDFDGDGRSDILDQRDIANDGFSYIYHSNGDGTFTKQTPIAYDVHDDDSFLYPGDYDGDGCTDLLVQNHDRAGANEIVYMCNPAAPVYALPFGDWAFDTGHQVITGDFNGDGKTDVLLAGGPSNSQLWLSTGTGMQDVPVWFSQTLSGVPTLIDPSQYAISTGDFNADGKTDIVMASDGGGPILVWLSTGANFAQPLSIPEGTGGGGMRVVAADWNSDGATDLWVQNPNAGQNDVEVLFHYTPELISAVTNGLGISTYVTYDRLNRNGALYTKCPGAPGTYICGDTWPVQDVDGPLYVVSHVDSSTGIATCTVNSANCYSSSYAYAGARADISGRGFGGFSQVTVTDLETGVVQTTNYATAFPYTGMVTSQTKVANGQTIGTTTNSFTSGTGGDCGAHTAGTIYCIALASTVVQGWELSTTAGTPGAALPTVETDYAGYDAYGNVGTVTVNTTPATGGSPDVTKVTTNSWQNIVDANHWLLGRLTEADVTATYAGQSTPTRHSAYTYDTGTGLLTSETVEPGGAANVTVTTSYLYDGFGNKHVVTVTGGDAPPCATQTDYDTRGQFPVTVTNCIGEHETYTYLQPFSAAFGFADSHTGPNGLTTHWSYDSFGRQTQELRPDGTRSTVTYQYCSGTNGGSDANCPSHGAFSVYSAVQGSDGATQIAPNGRSFFDGLSRALAADAQGFDGSWIRTSTLYDAFGRVSKSSRPYFLAAQNPCASGSFTYCSTFTYDTLGRVTKALQPNGGFTLTSYQGLTTVSTLRDFRLDGTFVNEVTTTVKNDLGAPATVTDASGATTTFTYDALGETLTITDAMGHQLANNVYDQRGRKTESHDADMGHWTYSYNSLGQLTSQTDARGNTVTLTYDLLGRMLTRTESGMTSSWVYGNASNQGIYPNSIDKLVLTSCAGVACGNADENAASGTTSRTYQYDTLGRQNRVTIAVGSSSFFSTLDYDSISGKAYRVRAFSGFVTDTAFNATGYASEIDDDANHAIAYWKANARDAEMHLTAQTTGNGMVTSQSFDALSGRLHSVCATRNAGPSCDGAVANQFFDFDTAGNLAERDDTINNSVETFAYDSLNRLKTDQLTVGTVPSTPLTMTYDAVGNILTKSDTGTYSYIAGTHRLASIASCIGCLVNGVASPGFTYDLNGNMTGGAGRAVAYTAFNMTATINPGSSSSSVMLGYDSGHARIQQVSAVGTTLYLNDGGVMSERLTPSGGGQSIWKTYIQADGQIVAERKTTGSSGGPAMSYFVLDHLGSILAITDDQSTTVTRQYFDAWGKMRNADGTPDTTCSLPAQSQALANTKLTRGFANQEQMPGVCLVNMNARIYDPQVGRFLTADPSDGSGLNRYWYVGDNPLSLTDPTGLCFLGCFWKSPTGKAAIAIVVFVLLQQDWALPALFTDMGATAAESALVATAVAGGVSGLVSTGKLSGALMGSFEALAFYGADFALRDASILGSHTAAEFVGRGLVGGMFSIGQKGGFPAGFMAAGLSSLADSVDLHNFAANAIVHGVAGGVGATLGGGKFANGAVTGTFSYVASNFASDEYDDDDASNNVSGGKQISSKNTSQADMPARVKILGIDYQHTYTDVLEQVVDANGDPLKGSYQVKEKITPDVGDNGNHKPPFTIPAGGSFTDTIGWPDPKVQPTTYVNQKVKQTWTVWYNNHEYHPDTLFEHTNYYDPVRNEYNNDIKVLHK